MNTNLKRRHIIAGLAALPFSSGFAVWAQDAKKWPTKPVKLMVGFPAGGGADAMGRLIAAKLSDRLGQQFIVDNRTGATGTICSDLVAKSSPDGYTLQLAHINSNAIGPLLVGKGRFDPINDFTPIKLLGITPQILAHHPKHKFGSVADLIKFAKANPAKLTFASSGVGSIQHIAGEAFKLQAGVDMLHVPFKGTGEALAGLLSGDIDMTFSSAGAILPQVKAGKLAMLAVCTPKRLASLPNVPTVAETLPGFDVATWYGLAGPAKLPKEIVERLNNEVTAILKDPEVVNRFKELDAEVGAGTPEQFGQFWRKEIERYKKLIKDAKIEA